MPEPETPMHRNSPLVLLLPILLVLLFVPELSLLAGNKFETIGGGVSGSTSIKLKELKPIFLGFGSFLLLAAILSLLPLGHKNALTLNHSKWQLSSAIFFGLSAIFFILSALI